MSKKQGLGLKSMFGEFPARVGEVWVIWLAMCFAVAPVSRSLENAALAAIAPTFVACVVWWLEYRASDDKVTRAEGQGRSEVAGMETARDFYRRLSDNRAAENDRLKRENQRLQNENKQVQRLQNEIDRNAQQIERLERGLRFRTEQMQRLLTERGSSDGQ